MMASSGKAHQVVTINPEFVIEAQRNNEFNKVLNNASLGLPDGMGIIWSARFLGQQMKERVAGVDVVWAICKLASESGLRVFFLGAAPGVAEIAASRLKSVYPRLEIAGNFSGSPKLEDEEEICSRIEEAKPDVLMVAFGAPQQDLWIARTASRLKVPVAIGVGGAFDYIAGITKRAPRWLQRAGFEWLFRLIRQPWRWKRMTNLPRFAGKVVWERFR